MARRRMIEVSIAHDKQFNSLSEFSQLLYLKILPHTDDYGRFEGDALIIKARVDPLSNKKVEKYEKSIIEIAEKGLWFVYETDKGKRVIQFKPDTFERINAFLIKKRGNPEYEEYIDLYKVISGDITYKVISKKQEVKSKKQEEATHPLQIYIRDELPSVGRLESQLTAEECEKLISEFGEKTILDKLHSMENYKQLTSKYKSVNLTLRNWIKRDKENEKSKGSVQSRLDYKFDPNKSAARYETLKQQFGKWS